MRIHILGVCGTFMGGIAALAKAAGHHVSGSDANVYPPMSTQLRKLGITLQEGYDEHSFGSDADAVVVGNVLSRGNPAVEALLNSGLPYYSGPQWLAENVLRDKWVVAVAGTHGKTTTTSMLAWILDYAGLDPGFLIGGVNAFELQAHSNARITPADAGVRIDVLLRRRQPEAKPRFGVGFERTRGPDGDAAAAQVQCQRRGNGIADAIGNWNSDHDARAGASVETVRKQMWCERGQDVLNGAVLVQVTGDAESSQLSHLVGIRHRAAEHEDRQSAVIESSYVSHDVNAGSVRQA